MERNSGFKRHIERASDLRQIRGEVLMRLSFLRAIGKFMIR
jgi:hypothetical protein